MTSGSTDWHQAFARVSGQLVRGQLVRGQLVRGQQRATTHELLTVHLGIPQRLRRVMRDLGWLCFLT